MKDKDFFMNIFLFVWPKCRMKCKYCLESNTNNYEKFDKEKILSILNIFAKEKVARVWLTGGEATLCPYILEYIKLCKQNNIDARFSTQDGLALNHLAKDLYDINIQLSLNGIYNFHDDITQIKNSFLDIENAVKNINKNFSDHNINFSARFILRLDYIEHLDDCINWCINNNIKKIYLSNISNSGKGKSFVEKNNRISKQEFNDILKSLHKKYGDIIQINEKHNGKQGDLCGVYPNGDVYIRPVNFTTDGKLYLGNLFKKNPKEIYKNFKQNYPDLHLNYLKKINTDGTL